MAIRSTRLSWEQTPTLDSFANEDEFGAFLLEATPAGVAIDGEVVYGTPRWENFRMRHPIEAAGLLKRASEILVCTPTTPEDVYAELKAPPQAMMAN